jgi:hypothetical protein
MGDRDMAVLTKGSFTLDLKIIKLDAELSEDDRQCAWELYTEMSTRVAVTGKHSDPDCTNFNGELYIESLDSLFRFFQEARGIMRKFPVGKIGGSNKEHLGVMVNKVMSHVLRPFLEKWQVKFRHWWENQSNPRLSPIDRQKEFPELEAFLSDWTSLRWLMRAFQKELVVVYSLVDVGAKEK